MWGGGLTHGAAPTGEEVDKSDNELLLCVMFPSFALFSRLRQEDVYVSTNLPMVFTFFRSHLNIVNPTSPSL